MNITDKVAEDIRIHSAQEFPRECCGLVTVRFGKQVYVPCRNIAESNEHFVIHPEDQAQVEDTGGIVAVVHSHINVPPLPSQADLTACESTGVPWFIINQPTGAMHSFEPSGYRAPLIGREFAHGILDCYALVRDFYLDEMGIALPDYHRDDLWWEKGQSLYLDNYRANDFYEVETPQKYDVLLMQVMSGVPNHAAVFLGDGLILHHQMGRLSSRDVYGGWYRKITTHIMRHRSVNP